MPFFLLSGFEGLTRKLCGGKEENPMFQMTFTLLHHSAVEFVRVISQKVLRNFVTSAVKVAQYKTAGLQ